MPLLIIAGKEYGSGSSRDWAAKGVALLGVKAVIAESFERIHRTNLVGMGVLPLQFLAGENAASLGLTGRRRIRSKAWRALGGGEDGAGARRTDDGSERRSARWCAWIRRRRPNTSAMAAFCRTCCGSWRGRSGRGGPGCAAAPT